MNGGEPKKSIWQSPWTWTIGGCCLGCIAIPLLIMTVLGGGAFWAFRSGGFSEVRADALARAKASPAVVATLGEPIDSSFPRNTSVNVNNSHSAVRMTLPLSGPKGAGRLRVEAERDGGQPWTYSTLSFENAAGEETDLRSAADLQGHAPVDELSDDTAGDDTAVDGGADDTASDDTVDDPG